jgi:hypothetical protein
MPWARNQLSNGVSNSIDIAITSPAGMVEPEGWRLAAS